MKNLLTIILMLISLSAFSQVKVNDIAIPEDIQYIRVIAYQPGLGKLRAVVDYGQPVNITKAQTITKDGSAIRFNSNMDVFNFFIKEGWIYIDTNYLQAGNTTYAYYIFKRK